MILVQPTVLKQFSEICLKSITYAGFIALDYTKTLTICISSKNLTYLMVARQNNWSGCSLRLSACARQSFTGTVSMCLLPSLVVASLGSRCKCKLLRLKWNPLSFTSSWRSSSVLTVLIVSDRRRGSAAHPNLAISVITRNSSGWYSKTFGRPGPERT